MFTYFINFQIISSYKNNFSQYHHGCMNQNSYQEINLKLKIPTKTEQQKPLHECTLGYIRNGYKDTDYVH